MFASEHIQLLAEYEDLQIFVFAGYAGDAEEVDESDEQLEEEKEEHTGIVVSDLANGKIASAMRSIRHPFWH